MRARLLGERHPRVAADLAAWAALVDGCGRPAEAEALLRNALAVSEAAYGPEHHDVAAALHNLAALAHRRGDLDEARARYTRALAVKDAVLGPGHPESAITLINLGALHRARRRPDQAEACYGRAVEALRRAAPDHPHLAAARRGLADARAELPPADVEPRRRTAPAREEPIAPAREETPS